MPPEDLYDALHLRPFEPFIIQVSDGTQYTIRHPDLVLVGLRSAVIGIPAAGKKAIYERYETVALSHVVKLLPVETKEAGTKG